MVLKKLGRNDSETEIRFWSFRNRSLSLLTIQNSSKSKKHLKKQLKLSTLRQPFFIHHDEVYLYRSCRPSCRDLHLCFRCGRQRKSLCLYSGIRFVDDVAHSVSHTCTFFLYLSPRTHFYRPKLVTWKSENPSMTSLPVKTVETSVVSKAVE